MKRRDFVRNTAIAAAGASLIAPLASLAAPAETHLESSDLTLLPIYKDDYALHFMALGDWGRNGEYHQTEVAKQMGIWGAEHPNDFVVSVGDNFYPSGVVSENDPLWHYSFENIYTAHSLQCDWYPIFGNHDYHTDVDAQIRYSKVSRRWVMPSRYYSKELNLKGKGKALLVFMDTDPFLHPAKAEYVATEMKWLNETLSNAGEDIKWKIVIGHHPCYTVGPRIDNYDTHTMNKALLKTLEDHKVDVYLTGHEHSLQHLKTDGFTNHFISGAGSELTEVTKGVSYSKFAASEHGFMYFAVDSTRLNVQAINMEGKVIYQTELTK